MDDKAIRAYHFLREDMTAGAGSEPPWAIGEERTWEGSIKLCESGYHSSPDWLSALDYAPGPVACLVEVSRPVERDETKQVSRSRRLLAAVNVERELREFACDCAERMLLQERELGREPDACSWEAVAVARAFARGEATGAQLDAAWVAARDAAGAARDAAQVAWAAAGDAARDAAWAAAGAAAWAAARAAIRQWQRERLNELLGVVA